jgi:hypothetical protein
MSIMLDARLKVNSLLPSDDNGSSSHVPSSAARPTHNIKKGKTVDEWKINAHQLLPPRRQDTKHAEMVRTSQISHINKATHQIRSNIANQLSIFSPICIHSRRIGCNERQPELAVIYSQPRIQIKIKSMIQQDDLEIVWRSGHLRSGADEEVT